MLLSQVVRQATQEYKSIVEENKNKMLPIPDNLMLYNERYDEEYSVLSVIENLSEDSLTADLIEVKQRVVSEMTILQDKIQLLIAERSAFNDKLKEKIKNAEKILFETINIPEYKITNYICVNRKNISNEVLEYIKNIAESIGLQVIVHNRNAFIYYSNNDWDYNKLVDKIMLKLNAEHDSKYSESWKYMQNNFVHFDPRYSFGLADFLEKIGK